MCSIFGNILQYNIDLKIETKLTWGRTPLSFKAFVSARVRPFRRFCFRILSSRFLRMWMERTAREGQRHKEWIVLVRLIWGKYQSQATLSKENKVNIHPSIKKGFSPVLTHIRSVMLQFSGELWVVVVVVLSGLVLIRWLEVGHLGATVGAIVLVGFRVVMVVVDVVLVSWVTLVGCVVVVVVVEAVVVVMVVSWGKLLAGSSWVSSSKWTEVFPVLLGNEGLIIWNRGKSESFPFTWSLLSWDVWTEGGRLDINWSSVDFSVTTKWGSFTSCDEISVEIWENSNERSDVDTVMNGCCML